MMKLPKFITNSILDNHTSLGDHPSFPPEDEDKFLQRVVTNYFSKITDGIETDNVEQLRTDLGRLITKCRKIEGKSKESLEKLAVDIVNDLFEIPDDTIILDARLVSNVDTSKQRLIPEKTEDYEFDSIDDMSKLSDEIYKRRMLNTLLTGASMYYSTDVSLYLSDLFKISPELPYMYDKILKYNIVLMYFEKDSINSSSTEAGCVDVYMEYEQNMVKIKAQAILFPILLNEIIKGLSEIAISHGLPKERKKAEYVIKKSDFKLAEMWDMRLGLPLWNLITKRIKDIGCNMEDIGVNFFLMVLSNLTPSNFNMFLREVFGNTKKGHSMLRNVVNKIISNKEKDEFNDYIAKRQNDTYQLSDSEYFTPDELITDSVL